MVKVIVGIILLFFFQLHDPSIFNAVAMTLSCIFLPCLFLVNILVYCKNRILRILSIAFVIAVGVSLMSMGIQTIKLTHESTTWPSIKGQVFISEKAVGGAGVYGTVREINYRYLIQGKKYSNNRISWRFSQKDALFQRYKQEQYIDVYYNPVQPEQSILEPGFGWIASMKLFYGIAISCASILTLMACEMELREIDEV